MSDARLREAELRYRKTHDDSDRRVWVGELSRAGLLSSPPFEIQLKPVKTGTQFSPPAKDKWYTVAAMKEGMDGTTAKVIKLCILHQTDHKSKLAVGRYLRDASWKKFQCSIPLTFYADFLVDFRSVGELTERQKQLVSKWDKPPKPPSPYNPCALYNPGASEMRYTRRDYYDLFR